MTLIHGELRKLSMVIIGRVDCSVILEEDDEEDRGEGGSGGTMSSRITPPSSPSSAGPPRTRPLRPSSTRQAPARRAACGPTLHQRSVAALVGTLLPPRPVPRMSAHGRVIVDPNVAVSPRPSDLHRSLAGACSSREAESRAAAARAGDAEGETVSPLMPMVVMVGATRDGIEVTAVRVSKPQANWPSMELHCPYGNVSIEAAMHLRFRIYQKTSPGGGWIRVRDDMLPLTVVEAGTLSR